MGAIAGVRRVSTAGHSLKAAASDSRLLRPLAVLGLSSSSSTSSSSPGFFDMEITAGTPLRQPHRHPSQQRADHPARDRHDRRDRHRRGGPLGRRGHGHLGLRGGHPDRPPEGRVHTSGYITAVVGDSTYSFAPMPVVFVVAMLAALACGVWNGVLVAYVRIQPMVATLVTVDRWPRDGRARRSPTRSRSTSSTTPSRSWGTVSSSCPSRFFVVIAVFLGSWLLLRRTALGLFVESVGVSSRASLYAGIKEKRIKLFAYVFCALCAGSPAWWPSRRPGRPTPT